MAQLLLHPLRAAVVGVGILHAELGVLHLLFGLGRGEVALQAAPQLVIGEVLQALLGHDDVEPRGVEAGEDAVAAQDEVLGTQGAYAVLAGVQPEVNRLQAGAAHEGRVSDGHAEARHLVAVHIGILVEGHRLQLLLVLEGLLADGHRALQAAGTDVDVGIGHVVGHALQIGVVDEVLRRGGDDLPHHAHLVHVGDDVRLHAAGIFVEIAATYALVGRVGFAQGSGESAIAIAFHEGRLEGRLEKVIIHGGYILF